MSSDFRPQFDELIYSQLRELGDDYLIVFDSSSQSLTLRRHNEKKEVLLVMTRYFLYMFKRKGMKLYYRWPVRDVSLMQQKDGSGEGGRLFAITSRNLDDADESLQDAIGRFYNGSGQAKEEEKMLKYIGQEDEYYYDKKGVRRLKTGMDSAESRDQRRDASFETVCLEASSARAACDVFDLLEYQVIESKNTIYQLSQAELGKYRSAKKEAAEGGDGKGKKRGGRRKFKVRAEGDDEQEELANEEDDQEEEDMDMEVEEEDQPTQKKNSKKGKKSSKKIADDSSSSGEEESGNAINSRFGGAGGGNSSNTNAGGKNKSKISANGGRFTAISTVLDSDVIDYNVLKEAFATQVKGSLSHELKLFVEENAVRIEDLCKIHYPSFLNASQQCHLVKSKEAKEVQEELSKAVKSVIRSVTDIRAVVVKFVEAFETKSNMEVTVSLLNKIQLASRLLQQAEKLLSAGSYLGAITVTQELVMLASTSLSSYVIGEYVLTHRAPAIRNAALNAGLAKANQWLLAIRRGSSAVGEALMSKRLIATGSSSSASTNTNAAAVFATLASANAAGVGPSGGYRRKILFSLKSAPERWGIVDEYIPASVATFAGFFGALSNAPPSASITAPPSSIVSAQKIVVASGKKAPSVIGNSINSFGGGGGDDPSAADAAGLDDAQRIAKVLREVEAKYLATIQTVVGDGASVQELFNVAGQGDGFLSYYTSNRIKQLRIDLAPAPITHADLVASPLLQILLVMSTPPSIVATINSGSGISSSAGGIGGASMSTNGVSASVTSAGGSPDSGRVGDSTSTAPPQTVTSPANNAAAAPSPPPHSPQAAAVESAVLSVLGPLTKLLALALGTMVVEDVVFFNTSPKLMSSFDITNIWEAFSNDIANTIVACANRAQGLGNLPNFSPEAVDAIMIALVSLVNAFTDIVVSNVRCAELNTTAIKKALEQTVSNMHGLYLVAHQMALAVALEQDTLDPILIASSDEFKFLITDYSLNLVGRAYSSDGHPLGIPMPMQYRSGQLYLPFSSAVTTTVQQTLLFLDRCLTLLGGNVPPFKAECSAVPDINILLVSGFPESVTSPSSEDAFLGVNNIDAILIENLKVLFKFVSGSLGNKLDMLDDRTSAVQLAMMITNCYAMGVVVTIVEQRFCLWWNGAAGTSANGPTGGGNLASCQDLPTVVAYPHLLRCHGEAVLLRESKYLFDALVAKASDKLLNGLKSAFDELLKPIRSLSYWKKRLPGNILAKIEKAADNAGRRAGEVNPHDLIAFKAAADFINTRIPQLQHLLPPSTVQGIIGFLVMHAGELIYEWTSEAVQSYDGNEMTMIRGCVDAIVAELKPLVDEWLIFLTTHVPPPAGGSYRFPMAVDAIGAELYRWVSQREQYWKNFAEGEMKLKAEAEALTRKIYEGTKGATKVATTVGWLFGRKTVDIATKVIPGTGGGSSSKTKKGSTSSTAAFSSSSPSFVGNGSSNAMRAMTAADNDALGGLEELNAFDEIMPEEFLQPAVQKVATQPPSPVPESKEGKSSATPTPSPAPASGGGEGGGFLAVAGGDSSGTPASSAALPQDPNGGGAKKMSRVKK